MEIYALFLALSTLIYLFLGGYVLQVNTRSPLNRMFSFICLTFGIWAVSEIFITYSLGVGDAWFWFKISSIGWVAGPTFLFHFFLIIVDEQKNLYRRWWILVPVYVPALIFIAKLTSGFLVYDSFEKVYYGWAGRVEGITAWAVIYYFYYGVYFFIGFIMLYRYGKRASHPAVFRQSLVIISSGTIAVFLATTSNVILPILRISVIPPVGSMVVMIWVMGIMYAMIRYRFLALTPELAARDIIKIMGNSMILCTWDRKIMAVNKAAEELLGHEEKYLMGRSITESFPDVDVFNSISRQTLTRDNTLENRQIVLKKGDESVILSLSASPVVDPYYESAGFVVILHDITEIKRSEEEVRFLGTHDTLTNLPNRLLSNDRLRQAIAQAERHKTQIAVMMIDLDNFKKINITLGHSMGDSVIQEVAVRLLNIVRDYDTLARMSGDLFVVIISDLPDSGFASAIAARILESLKQPFIMDHHHLHLTASIGISMYPLDGDSVETLIKYADLALHQVKVSEKNNYKFFSKVMSSEAVGWVTIESDLREAIEREEFLLYYQPIINLDNGNIEAAEALLRWKHPKNGMIPPLEFIPVAEKSGMIIPIGEWVLKQACLQSRAWLNAGFQAVPVTVNFSAMQFKDPKIIGNVKEVLAEINLSPELLYIEITETTAIQDIEKSLVIMKTLNDIGIRILIDDFGAGYSSLRYLKQLPVYAIKIDRFFINNIVNDYNDAAIVTAIISIAHSMNMKVIAEGVETAEQLEFLRSLDWKQRPSLKCERVQGFYFSKPLTAVGFEEFLRINIDQSRKNGIN